MGGTVWLSWGDGIEGTGSIEAWEEGQRLRYREPGAEDAVPILVEYTIEATASGTTRLRMVNSGFDAGDDWADYTDTVDSGWRYFLWNLKVYLERHRGVARTMVSRRQKIDLSRTELWHRLLDGGLITLAGTAEEGAKATLWSGDSGRIHQVNSGIHFAARFEGINDALLLLELEPGKQPFSLGVWLSLYDVEDERVRSLQSQLDEALRQLGPAA